ncbi:unnamed protein product [Chondrus crispus]|uniref:Uncharacterized protein n=1 Tax=Chondrus crispus TaxID=2769 RepID=R7QEY6_CHOCR|nr:unnamed protein product [Chondrus crispus]CDF37077.1 unnamed protein product [Chondrus crispus]|eukprot:XP_005716896.1 unnamed protein product [Chondrus crispus]
MSLLIFITLSPDPLPFRTLVTPASTVRLPLCPHILLFSAARHGSTWFIDSAERCKYSSNPLRSNPNRGDHIIYSRDINKNSELWHPGREGPLLNISAEDVAEYVRTTGSVKVFPIAMEKSEQAVRIILESIKRKDIEQHVITPVVILTRRLDDAHNSLLNAKESGVWNKLPSARDGVEGVTKRTEVSEEDQYFRQYRRKRLEYFQDVRTLVRDVDVVSAEFDYDDVKGMKNIEIQDAGCYISNCNFERMES